MKTKKQATSKSEQPKNTTTKKRFVLGLFLLVFDFCVWSYFSYQVGMFLEGHAYQTRCKIQRMKVDVKKLKKHKVADAVAYVDGTPITMTQLKEMVQSMPQLSEMPFEQVYPNLLEMIVNNQVIMQGAEKAGLMKRPDIQQQLRLAKEQIVGQTYLDELLAAEVTPEEVQALYDKEIQNFRREEEIHARHILVKTEKEAKDILVQLKAGADFAQLADKKSLDENTEGGDLGYFTKPMMIPEFGDAVFDMKKGQLSAPIKTPFGWHIVIVEDKRLANPPAIEEVYDDLKRALMETKLKTVLEKERTKLNVQILKPTL